MTDPAGYPHEPAGYLQPPVPNGDLHSNGAGSGVERRRSAELTPAERVQQRRNRRLLLSVAVPALLLGAAALIASILADKGAPSPHALFVPPGYHAVTDGVFSYSVPNSWSKNDAFSDDVGDLETSGGTGWVGDHLTARPSAPVAGEPPPHVFQSFGMGRPTPFDTSAAVNAVVRHATVAYRYEITRPGGFNATAIDAWESSSGAELWLMINADPRTTAEIISTING